MEGNKKLSHDMPMIRSSTKLTSHCSQSSDPSSSLFFLESKEKLKNKTQECKSLNTKENDDKGKDKEEGHEARVEETGRERLKRLREEVMMEKVKIPEKWGQEQMLKDWMDITMFDAFFAPPHSMIVTARDALIANARKAKSPRLRI
ncbi:protein BIC1 [Cajanus cajan]|uniref:Protein BIC1 n=1 Tax=Cajanus cajan TaxID=3821 RepID=A0A151RN14_CAJCA|nr:protein BIC1 [Cajanus cajan]XP_020238127.1 protein BIC1 [Cajanus cajan]KYP43905.1 hypothetical protein KK1_034638 [Cajanus cajan]KYP62904.1 hypothetical protein KK1_017464 [Cajanus cajan]